MFVFNFDMGMFKDLLGSEESLFRNHVALDYDYMPKVIPYRENEQRYIAMCIKPLFMERNGKNVIVHGPPGVGKTVAVRHLLQELEEETESIIPIYVNCWKKNTTFKIMQEICDMIGLKFIQNKKTDELYELMKRHINKKSTVFVFDEIDKVEDHDFLYNILEEIYRKTIILITNYSNWLNNLDNRIKSRLMPDSVHFRPYNLAETKGILKERVSYAFVPNVWEEEAFELIASKTYEIKDIRTGLYLLREAGNIAEDEASRKILVSHAKKALEKLDNFSINKSEDLEEEAKFILGIIKENPQKKIGELYKIYQEKGGNAVYKTFQRKIKKLEDGKFIKVKKIAGGKEGKTSIISPSQIKKLDEF